MRKLSGKRAELRRYFEEYSVSLYADGATHICDVGNLSG